MDTKLMGPQNLPQPLPNQPVVPPQPIAQPNVPLSPQIISQQPVQNKPSIFSILFKIIIFLIILAMVVGGLFFVKNNPQFLGKIQSFIPNQKTPSSSTASNQTQKTASTQSLAQTSGIKFKDMPANKETLTPYTQEELDKLGVVKLPAGFAVQAEYKGIKFVKSSKKSFTDSQIQLLHQFIDNTPKKLLSPGPSAIITFEKGEIETGLMIPGTVAFASGNYIFFNDKSFDQTGFMIDNDMDKVFSAFEHELIHIAQFNLTVGEMGRESLTKSIEEDRYVRLMNYKTPLFTEFATIAGWYASSKTAQGVASIYDLTDKDKAVTTDYGKTDIAEDMAETIAGMIMTRDYEFSPQRQQWALKFLGESSAASFKPGKFPFSPLFEETKIIAFNNYDVNKEQEYKSKYKMSDRQTFMSEKQGALEEIKNFFSQELTSRGWTGSFTQGSARYKGEFTGSKRDMYIELINDSNIGGVVIIIVNGYKL